MFELRRGLTSSYSLVFPHGTASQNAFGKDLLFFFSYALRRYQEAARTSGCHSRGPVLMLTVAGWELRGGGPAPSPLHLAGLPAVQRRPRQAPALPACCSALQPHRVPLHLLLEAVPGVCQLPSQAAAAQAPAAGCGATDRGSVQPAPGPPAHKKRGLLG